MKTAYPTATITSSTLQREIGKVIKRVAMNREHLTVHSNGFPVAVILPVADYKMFIAQKADQDQKPATQTEHKE
jgi:prevent-host-death family protein